jgi:hypothetical protein
VPAKERLVFEPPIVARSVLDQYRVSLYLVSHDTACGLDRQYKNPRSRERERRSRPS